MLDSVSRQVVRKGEVSAHVNRETFSKPNGIELTHIAEPNAFRIQARCWHIRVEIDGSAEQRRWRVTRERRQ